MEKCRRFIKNNLLLVLLLCSLCLGIGLGAAMRSVELNDREKMYFRSINVVDALNFQVFIQTS